MILYTHNDSNLESLAEAEAVRRANETAERQIRQMFDNAVFSANAKGYIKAAEKLGFTDLATEMQSDLNEMHPQLNALESRKEVA